MNLEGRRGLVNVSREGCRQRETTTPQYGFLSKLRTENLKGKTRRNFGEGEGLSSKKGTVGPSTDDWSFDPITIGIRELLLGTRGYR